MIMEIPDTSSIPNATQTASNIIDGVATPNTDSIEHVTIQVGSVLQPDEDRIGIAESIEVAIVEGATLPGTASKRKYNHYEWVKLQTTFTLTDDECTTIFDESTKKFKPNYINFFSKKLNSLCIECVTALRKKESKGKISVEFYCLHPQCERLHRLKADNIHSIFSIEQSGNQLHKSYVTRPLNRDIRVAARKSISTKTVKTFHRENYNACNKQLLASGNMQDVISFQTAYNLKSEALSENDFHQNHILDLSLMKSQQMKDMKDKVPGADYYLQLVSAAPFFVIAFSDIQMQILKELMDRQEIIILHVDATGSIIATPEGVETRIYYYVATIALKILDEEVKMLFPLMEMVSSAHDAFTIGVWFDKFVSEFTKKYNKPPMINHFVTDFSFAIINAGVDSFNKQTLLEFINETYVALHDSQNLRNVREALKTFFHVCCNHFSKTSAKDINEFFPKSECSNVVRVFLKETLAMCFNLSTLQSLEDAYRSLSVILNSKYMTEDVTTAINFITLLINSSDKNGHRKDKPEDKDQCDTNPEQSDVFDDLNDILTFDEIEDDTMYKSSLFYQKFLTLTHKGDYDVTKHTKLNNFYCPQYCDLILKKYIAILPLWTCLNNRFRFSNSNSESLFNIIKKQLRQQAPTIGEIPLKAGRFFRFSRHYINEIANDFHDQLPRKNCCARKPYQKRIKDNNLSTAAKRKSSIPIEMQELSKKQKLEPSDIPSTSTAASTPHSSPSSSPSALETRTGRVIRTPQRLIESSFHTPTSRRNTPSSPFTPTRRENTPYSPATPVLSYSPFTPNGFNDIPSNGNGFNYNTSSSSFTPTGREHIPYSPATPVLSYSPSTPNGFNDSPSSRHGINYNPSTPRSYTSTSRRNNSVTPTSRRNNSVTPTSRRNARTPTTPDNSLINIHSEESWGPHHIKRKQSYFEGNLLRNFTSPKVLTKIFEVNDKRVEKTLRFGNHLFDDVNMYMTPDEPFVVATFKNNRLFNSDFKSLRLNEPVTNVCVKYIINHLAAKTNQVQLILSETNQIILQSINQNLFKIRQQNLIAILDLSGQFSVAIMNFKKKTFTYIDPKTTKCSEERLYFDNFKKYLTQHNQIHHTAYEINEWTIANLIASEPIDHNNNVDSAIYVLSIVFSLVEQNKIDKSRSLSSFRIYLSHFILKNSAPMAKICLICGLKDDIPQTHNNDLIQWTECEICKRWCHDICLVSLIFKSTFKCVVCKYSEN